LEQAITSFIQKTRGKITTAARPAIRNQQFSGRLQSCKYKKSYNYSSTAVSFTVEKATTIQSAASMLSFRIDPMHQLTEAYTMSPH
jgi:hypothetical protein